MTFKLDEYLLNQKYFSQENYNQRVQYILKNPSNIREEIWTIYINDKKKLEKHTDFFEWWKIKSKKPKIPSINESTSAQKTWFKTQSKTTEKSIYPPFEEISINWNDNQVIAAPFKEVDNSEYGKIKSQNNYTNQMLHIISQRLEYLESKKEKNSLEKPLIKPNEEIKNFKLNKDDQLIEKIIKDDYEFSQQSS